jgi:protein-S-isoprenylcysteine O-methyltransferase Ste14
VSLPVAAVVIERGLMAREERYMEQKFGDVFCAYRAWVRR